jgi:hypothetical protein
MNEQLEKIIKAPLPTTTRNIRDLDRKEQAKIVRQLFKSLGFTGVSVTTPTYSMASSINISLPRQPWEGDMNPSTIGCKPSNIQNLPIMGWFRFAHGARKAGWPISRSARSSWPPFLIWIIAAIHKAITPILPLRSIPNST